ncbi:TetR/AcrR family transcriptional regulator [Mycolicibacterium wolinskyi]|uniref:Transcriptional regulator n=1 Tax=Mycolicibacterium wolinskyi TaxID=59750 RepID=A0A1X2FF89_9MYCO|nr:MULTISPECIES: TetR/AcrR family transcriptional regulator [Mycolicibacterium]MCV7290695.1 TetR/AcrR family transcriptional regulator [Mycolicibacterium wolinskyi]MCV7291745.1 TetR/AcrR family transcriptional regulator [Mycolicibacterium goodii]ORX17096.1 transcriptional regulator [Mycolicibacterium wolinskyi]
MTTETAKRTRAEHLGPDRRRPQVLDAALEIAASEGVANVTMGAVAARLGVTRPVVYACYGGRGELLAALLERETEVTLANLLAMLPPERTGSVEQMFVDGFCALLTTVRERPSAWQIMFTVDLDPVLDAAIVRGRAQIGEQVAAVMRPLMQRWQVEDIDVVLPPLSEVFLAICESAIRMLLNDPDHWTPERLAAIVGPAAYRAMRAR